MKIPTARTFVLCTIFFSLSAACFGQETFSGRWGIPREPFECEQNAAEMEQVLVVIEREPNPKGNLILIARLGKQEVNVALNSLRLERISQRYVQLGLSKDKIITAEGTKVNDFGRVEIYWNGELLGALSSKPNRNICLDCCTSQD